MSLLIAGRVWQGDLKRSLPTQAIIWFKILPVLSATDNVLVIVIAKEISLLLPCSFRVLWVFYLLEKQTLTGENWAFGVMPITFKIFFRHLPLLSYEIYAMLVKKVDVAQNIFQLILNKMANCKNILLSHSLIQRVIFIYTAGTLWCYIEWYPCRVKKRTCYLPQGGKKEEIIWFCLILYL